RAGQHLQAWIELTIGHHQLIFHRGAAETIVPATGGERLSSQEVSELPLNKRDFSQLLLLAAGTMTDANGAANFTQQFAVNGQRGSTTVFAMDGIDTTDPELGGATFSNFNVDAIQEIHSSSGVMPAEIGHGAAGFTEIISKSGTGRIHGTVFEFLRNAALDARNFTNLDLPTGVRWSCRVFTMATTEPSTSANTRDSARCSGRLRSSRFRPRKSEREGTRRPFPATRCWYRSTPRWHRCWRAIPCLTIPRDLTEDGLTLRRPRSQQ
ncbi:MAG: hypothetical protein DMG05_25625, partial [Acidobacteria bacterium]